MRRATIALITLALLFGTRLHAQNIMDVKHVIEKSFNYGAKLGINASFPVIHELSINDEGEVEIPDEQVVGKAADIFGPKVYGDIAVEFSGHMDDIAKAHEADDDDRVMLDNLKEAFKQSVTAPLVQAAKESYGSELKPRQQQQIERKVQADADIQLGRRLPDSGAPHRAVAQGRAQGGDKRDRARRGEQAP